MCMPTQEDLSHSTEDSIHNMRVNLILAKQVYGVTLVVNLTFIGLSSIPCI